MEMRKIANIVCNPGARKEKALLLSLPGKLLLS